MRLDWQSRLEKTPGRCWSHTTKCKGTREYPWENCRQICVSIYTLFEGVLYGRQEKRNSTSRDDLQTKVMDLTGSHLHIALGPVAVCTSVVRNTENSCDRNFSYTQALGASYMWFRSEDGRNLFPNK